MSRLADGIISGFDIAVIGRQIERRPTAFVGEIHIGAMFHQKRSQLVVPILRGDQQGAPSVARGLVHVRAGGEKCLDGIESSARAAYTSGVNSPPSFGAA